MQSKINLLKPLVSIVITSFNRGHLIEKAIQSAIDQDYENLEIIISDNCSQDNTTDIVEKFLDDPRIHFFQNEENIGMLKNFEHSSFTLASGKLISFVSSDDFLINPSFISDAVKAFNSYPNIGIVHSRNLMNSSSSNTLEYDYSYHFYKSSFYKKDYVLGREVFNSYPKCHSISFGGSVFKRDDLIQINPFVEGIFSFDVCLSLQLIQKYNVCFIDKRTYVVRRHGENYTSTIDDADTYLNNVRYIDIPFDRAILNKFDSEKKLIQWKNRMYVNYFFQIALAFFSTSDEQYAACIDFLKKNNPNAYRQLIFSPKFHFYKLLKVSNLISLLVSFDSKLKNWLRS